MVVYTVRLILWPVYRHPSPLPYIPMLTDKIRLSILTTYLIISHTAIIPHDPVLWFTLMVIPTGPPALLISGLAELSAEVTEGDKMAIAKMLAVSPSLLPLLFCCELADHVNGGRSCMLSRRRFVSL